MGNPLEEFRELYGEKTKEAASPMLGNFGQSMVAGLGMASAGAAFAGLTLGASKLVDAATKSHDFKKMLEHNPDLAEYQQRDPKTFNQQFSSLRAMNPGFSKDPIVAGSYMRQMADNPMAAGGILQQSLMGADKFKSPMADAFRRGGEHAGATFAKSLEPKASPPHPEDEEIAGLRREGDLHHLKAQKAQGWAGYKAGKNKP